MSTDDIKAVPAPWKLRGDVFSFPFWTNKEQIAKADAAGITYSPLEAKGGYASHEGNEHLGGMGMIQIIRYSESPVGPYDELILIPGFWEYVIEEKGKRVKKRNTRITRIYVSQKYTCWNGRKSESYLHGSVSSANSYQTGIFPSTLPNSTSKTMPMARRTSRCFLMIPATTQRKPTQARPPYFKPISNQSATSPLFQHRQTCSSTLALTPPWCSRPSLQVMEVRVSCRVPISGARLYQANRRGKRPLDGSMPDKERRVRRRRQNLRTSGRTLRDGILA